MPRAKGAKQDEKPDDGTPASDKPLHGFRKDVHALHFPPKVASGHYDRGVGLGGYDRDTGRSVPGEPVLRLPGDKEPRARPFESKKEDRH